MYRFYKSEIFNKKFSLFFFIVFLYCSTFVVCFHKIIIIFNPHGGCRFLTFSFYLFSSNISLRDIGGICWLRVPISYALSHIKVGNIQMVIISVWMILLTSYLDQSTILRHKILFIILMQIRHDDVTWRHKTSFHKIVPKKCWRQQKISMMGQYFYTPV